MTSWHCNAFAPLYKLRPRQNFRFLQMIFSNAFSWLNMYEFRLQFKLNLFRRLIKNIPALVKIMAWRRPGGKPLFWPMLVSLLTHICVTRPQWVNADMWIRQFNPVIHSSVRPSIHPSINPKRQKYTQTEQRHTQTYCHKYRYRHRRTQTHMSIYITALNMLKNISNTTPIANLP